METLSLGDVRNLWWKTLVAEFDLSGPAFVAMVRGGATWDSTVALSALKCAGYLVDVSGYGDRAALLTEVLAVREYPLVLVNLKKDVRFPERLCDYDPVGEFMSHLAIARIAPAIETAIRFLEDREALVAELEGRAADEMDRMVQILGDHPMLDQACLDLWHPCATPPLTQRELDEVVAGAARALGIEQE